MDQFLDMQDRPEGAAAVPTQSGFVFPDIDAMMAEVGATYPLAGAAAEATDEDSDRREALDTVILAGLVSG